MKGSLGDDTLMSIPLHAQAKWLQETLGVGGKTAAGGVPEWEAGSRGFTSGRTAPGGVLLVWPRPRLTGPRGPQQSLGHPS